MAVTVIGLDPSGAHDSSFNGDGERQYRFRYILRSDTGPGLLATYAALYTALAGSGVGLGNACPLDSGAVCNLIHPTSGPRRDIPGTGPIWDWTCEIGYSSKSDQNQSNEKDPTARLPKITVDNTDFTDAAKVSLGEFNELVGYVVNSAGDPYVREHRRGRIVIRIQKNFSTFNYTWCAEQPDGYRLSRNLNDWSPMAPYAATMGSTPIAAGKALLSKLTVANLFENGQIYVQVNAEYETDRDSFKDLVLDQGYQELLANGTKRRIVENGGLAMTPQNLNGAGLRLPNGQAPKILPFQYYPKLDWDPLDIP